MVKEFKPAFVSASGGVHANNFIFVHKNAERYKIIAVHARISFGELDISFCNDFVGAVGLCAGNRDADNIFSGRKTKTGESLRGVRQFFSCGNNFLIVSAESHEIKTFVEDVAAEDDAD